MNRNYEKAQCIGMIGRLTPQKNPMLFLHIAKTLLQKYHKLQFSILGAGLDDHLGNELKVFIEKNNLEQNLRLLPWGNSDTSKKFITETDIYVMTSVFEGLPYSLLEAMESGCACVVSKADGNTDIIQNNENGFACLSQEEFCDTIESLINNKVLREKMGRAAQRYVHEKHDILPAIGYLQNTYVGL